MIELSSILACPKCKTKLALKNNKGKCPKCAFAYFFEDGIWNLLYIKNPRTKKSQKSYDIMHRSEFEGPTDGSYEILASFAKGNRTVDIACGDGFIEEFSPETVAVEFSKNALLNARRKGARYLVLADAQNLPFVLDSFDLAISTGNLEQFDDPESAINEMVRISKIQILIVHREFPIPFAKVLRAIVKNLTSLEDQPIERPIKSAEIEKMLKNAGARIIYKGVWTIPVNHGKVVKFLPEFSNIPACSFFISIKK